MEFIAIVAATFTILLGMHYIPWHDATAHDELPKPAAYIIGTGTLTVLQLTALLLWPALNPSLVILAVVISGGAGVLAGYGLDAARHAKRANKILDTALEVRHVQNEGA